jgi:hypothetical protein
LVDSHGQHGKGMRAQAIARSGLSGWKSRSFLAAFLAATAVMAVIALFVSYLLWPTWPKSQVSLDAPAIPVIVAGVLFNVPPAAVRPKMQRQPGLHERMDLVFLWPSLTPPSPDSLADIKLPAAEDGEAPPAPHTDDRLFVTITSLGAVLPPLVRLRTIYPRYIETQATAGPDGLAIVAFRPGTPYDGEDLVYFADVPEQFFALCSRAARSLPGTCIQERALDAAVITLRFSREWLGDWRNTAAGFDRLVTQLHAPGK